MPLFSRSSPQSEAQHHRLGVRSLHEEFAPAELGREIVEELSKELVELLPEKPANKQCSPQNNIFFLKTHKAGSTTVQNILLR